MANTDKNWAYIKLETIALDFVETTGIPGTLSVIATEKSMPYPLAVVWYRWGYKSDVIEILNSYVTVPMRRQGIRTKINTLLFEDYGEDVQEIVTQSATADGEKWMLATGYKNLQKYWVVKRKPWLRSYGSR